LLAFRTDPITGIRTKVVRRSIVDNAHAAGLLVHTWTMRNDPPYLDKYYMGDPVAEYIDVYGLGVDGVFSDFADTAVAARRLFLSQSA